MVKDHHHNPQTIDSLSTTKNLISIEVECEGQQLNAVIDTGSTRNIVSKEFAHSLSMPRFESNSVLKLANNALVCADGETEIEIKLNNEIIKIRALVVENFPYNLLLGIQFCEQSVTIIDFKSKNVSVCGNNFYLPPKFKNYQLIARTARDLRIPKNSEKCIPIKVKTSANCLLLEPDGDFSSRFGLITCKTLSKVERDSGFLRVANITDSDIFIPKGARLAKGSEIEEVFYLEEETNSEILDGQKIKINDELEMKERKEIIKLLQKYSSVISKGPLDLGRAKHTKHKIETGNIPPIRSNPYRRSFKERETVDEEVDQVIESWNYSSFRFTVGVTRGVSEKTGCNNSILC